MKSHSYTTRRRFLKSSLGLAALLPLAACEGLGVGPEDSDTLFDGPTIDEDDFISYNARYYGLGVDEASQLPFTFIRDGVAAQETDPVSIAFRIQYLLSDSHHAATLNTLLDHLLAAQIDAWPPNNYRNMIPRLVIQPDGIKPATREYSFLDNALLSSRVAMVAQAYKDAEIGNKALQFLDKQRLGYNQVLLQSRSGFLPQFGVATLFDVDPRGLDLLFSGFYDAVAFVLGYFIGDTPIIGNPQVGLDTWQRMIDTQNTFAGEHYASTRAQTRIQSPFARNGSGFQFFHSLLSIDSSWLTDSMYNGLYNALYSYLDAAVYDRVPGCYSAGPHPTGFYIDNGLNRLASKQRFHTSREIIVTTDALAAAMRLFPEDSDARLILRGWMGLYASREGIITAQGYCGGMDKEGTPIQALYARQNGAMILFKSDGARLLNDFMRTQSRPGLQEMLGMVRLLYQDEPIVRVDAQLPIPIRSERLFSRR